MIPGITRFLCPLIALAMAVLAPAGLRSLQAAGLPNIIVILVDDMGFSDISCFGGEIPTPNIDRLAASGLSFTQFYNTGRCCPTRASLLTGLYSHQAGIGHMTEDKGVPGYRGFLNDRCVTIAEVLGAAGYFTAVAGKWHVGSAAEKWPLPRGFDRFYGVPQGGGFYFRPSQARNVVLNDRVLYSPDSVMPEGWYSTDAWTDYGIRFIDEALAAGKPFFLYLAHNAPHYPMQAPLEEITRFRGKYRGGWDQLREERHRRMIELGVVDKSWALSPRPAEVKAWEALTPEQQDRFDLIMAAYAAVVEHMDRSVGQLIEALQKRGALDNTLLLFLSDNGGNAESGPDGRLEGPGKPGTADSTIYVGQSWATMSNTPFRRYKHWVHEGGIATPLIAHWPARIKGTGGYRRQVGHVIDIMPTCLEVAGAKYPAEFKGVKVQPMEGRSLIPAFDNRPVQRQALFWEHEGNRAVRSGDWKLVAAGRSGPWELYNLREDRTEARDLASRETEIVGRLAAQWEAWALRAHVKPYPEDRAAK